MGGALPSYSIITSSSFSTFFWFNIHWSYVSEKISTSSFSDFLEYKFSKYFLKVFEFWSNFINLGLLSVFSDIGKGFNQYFDYLFIVNKLSLILSSFCVFFINFFPWLLFRVTYLILVCLAIFLVHNEIIWDIIYIYCKFLYLGNLLVDLPWMDPKLFISCTCLFFSFLEILSFFTDSFKSRLL